MTRRIARTPPSDRPPGTIVVVGAGISGLTVAYELVERAARLPDGPSVICLEATSRAGGNIRSERVDGFLCEAGPTGFLDSAPATLTLARRLQLAERMVRAEEGASQRFVFRKGRLHRVPTGPGQLVGSGVLSARAKLRLLAEPLVRRSRKDDESVHEFAARRIGREAAEVLVDALVSGIYAGDARQLSVGASFPKLRAMEREHGSLVRALLRRRSADGAGGGGPAGPGGTLTSFRDGLQELTDALAAALGDRLFLGSPIHRIYSMGQRGFRLLPAEGAPLEADAVVVTCPAWDAAPLLGDADGELASLVAEISTVPLAVVHTGFRTLALGDQPPGTGFLVPRNQGLRILGTLWITGIFPDRASKGATLLTTMVGGAHEPALAELPDKKLLELVRNDLQQAMGITVQPYFARIVRWARSIPQYTVGHIARLAAIDERLRSQPGLFLAGNSYRGVSVNACVEEAPSVAEAVLEFLARPRHP